MPVNIFDHSHCPQVRVWDLETLECEHALKQPRGHVWAPRGDVIALVAVEGAAWGGVGAEVVVWGRSA